jgi:hypothetical protein
LNTRAPADVEDRLQPRPVVDRAAGHVVGVLDLDQHRAGAVADVRRDGRLDRGGVEQTLGRGEGPRQQPGEGGHAADLVVDNVAAGVADHLAPRPAVEVQGDLIAHRAGGDEERRLHADGGRRLLLQAVDGRIFAEDVVPHLGLGHRPAHLRVGPGHRVGPQIDQLHSQSPYFPSPIPIRTAACSVSPFSTSMWI